MRLRPLLSDGGLRVARGRVPGDRNRGARSTDAGFAGGPARSSGDAPV